MSETGTGSDGVYSRMERAQRRRIWLSVVLPFSLALGIVAMFIGIALSLRRPAQVSILSDALLTLLVLCPMVALMFAAVILSVALVALMSRWTGRGRSPLRRLEAWTSRAEGRVDGWLGQIDGQVLNWAVRLAPIQQMLGLFDARENVVAEEGEE